MTSPETDRERQALATLATVREEKAKVHRQRDVLAQAIWDARAALGFDTDGDTRFHTDDFDMIARNHVRDATEARRDHDDAVDGLADDDAHAQIARMEWRLSRIEGYVDAVLSGASDADADTLAANVRSALSIDLDVEHVHTFDGRRVRTVAMVASG